MFRIPSKHSVAHYEPAGLWLRKRAVSFWHGVPNIFVKPFSFNHRFAFVCGCGHSGTTLISAKLGEHSEVFLIARETRAFAPEIGAYCSVRIVKEWDYFANADGKKLIVEKTPKHIHSISKIRYLIPGSRFIIVTRNPLDNVASLYVRFGDLNGAIGRWLADNRRILHLRQSRFVKVVSYEDLTTNPKLVLSDICDFLDLKWEKAILDTGKSGYDHLIDSEDNMAIRAEQVRRSIKPNTGGWRSSLSESDADMVVRRTEALARRLGYLDIRSHI